MTWRLKAALLAASISDLLAALSPQTGSGRGRGSGRPVILLNGQRIANFREMRNIPPEAIRRLEILPEEVALRYGYPADQRVINFILKDRFAARTIEADVIPRLVQLHRGNVAPHPVAAFMGHVEAEAFLRTLDKGLKKMDEIISTSAATGSIDGAQAFELYDTFGFPIDLTRLIAAENNLAVDETGFQEELNKQKERSRAATAMDTGDWQILHEAPVRFVGYDSLEEKTRILRYRKVTAKGKTLYQLVLETTPFYAESGGQVGDSGEFTITNGNEETKINIIDTKKENDLIIHFAEAIPADLSGDVLARVDGSRRSLITVHHSVTHLMHAALRQVLGTHVAQKGSLVNEEHLRFDFSHFAKMTPAEIAAVEKIVNEKIRENVPVVIQTMDKEKAVAMGAMALFGEKYGDQVRVVIMDPAYSIELCGGTHVGHTGELGLFKIKQESAVAAGVRRLEAVCGAAAENWINEQIESYRQAKEVLKNPKDLVKSIDDLMQENSQLNKRIESLEARQLVGIRNELLQKDEIIQNVSFIGDIIEVPHADALKKLCFDLKNHVHDHCVVLAANIGGRAHVAVSISATVAAAKGLDASRIIKETISPLIKGGGGGQKELATAGGTDVSQLPQAIAAMAQDGDVVLCMGAGSIGNMPGRLVELLSNTEQRGQEEKAQ